MNLHQAVKETLGSDRQCSALTTRLSTNIITHTLQHKCRYKVNIQIINSNFYYVNVTKNS